MNWQDELTWIDNVRNIIDHQNEITQEDIREAFIHMSYLYATEFINIQNLEQYIVDNHGEEAIESIVEDSPVLKLVSMDATEHPEGLESNLLDALDAIEMMG